MMLDKCKVQMVVLNFRIRMGNAGTTVLALKLFLSILLL